MDPASALLWLLLAAPRGYDGPRAIAANEGSEVDPIDPAPASAADARETVRGAEPMVRTHASGTEVAQAPDPRTWVVGVFVDAGYVVNSNFPDNHVNRGISTAPRTGEFTVPYAAAYLRHDPSAREPWQLELALQVGPAAAALVNTEPEPGGDASRFAGSRVWQHLARANVGGRIPKAGTEISAGLFTTPIGLWSFWTKDNWTYSTPWHLNAVPYVLMGGRVLQPVGKRVVLHAWVVNGWQTYADLNKVPSYMGGLVATPMDGMQVAQFVYFGAEDVDPAPRAWRMLSDTWFVYDAGRWGISAVFDVMRERLTTFPDAPVALYVTGAITPRVRVISAARDRVKWFLAARGEAFWDRDGRMSGVDQLLLSAGANSDVDIFGYALVRIEYRYDRTDNPAGFFYRHEAIEADDEGLGRDQHTVYLTLTGMFEHWFATHRKPR